MKYKIKELLSSFGCWLWNKFRVITATEMMIMEEANKERKCEHCGLDPIHYLEDCDCKKFRKH